MGNDLRGKPGQNPPAHVLSTQDEFILMQADEWARRRDGQPLTAHAGDKARRPRGVPHGCSDTSDTPGRALLRVVPAGRLKELFYGLDTLTDVRAALPIPAKHDVDFLPPEANE